MAARAFVIDFVATNGKDREYCWKGQNGHEEEDGTRRINIANDTHSDCRKHIPHGAEPGIPTNPLPEAGVTDQAQCNSVDTRNEDAAGNSKRRLSGKLHRQGRYKR